MASRIASTSRFNHATNSVRVENISQCVNRREIVALFDTLIGEVCSSEDCKDDSRSYLKITFDNSDASKKAIRMTGYMIGGMPLVVTPTSDRLVFQTNPADGRRNLYVLGLPFALTKIEFAGIFARYGNVSHCVILATVDNASRRRGFVVMSSHEEAKLAMSSLSRTHIKGHALDISWAVVQRSQGFLDGGDRNAMLESRSTPSPDSLPNDLAFLSCSDSSLSSSGNDLLSPGLSLIPTSTLLVTNLPTVLFSQTLDMHPLFYPFGLIKRLEVLGSPLNVRAHTTSVVVEYALISSAKEAKETLQGQHYANHTINPQYLQAAFRSLELSSEDLVGSTLGNTNNSSLNPFAVPFVLQTPGMRSFASALSYYNSRYVTNYNNAPALPGAPIESRVPSAFALHISEADYHLPVSRMASRSSSASSRLSNESSLPPSSRGFQGPNSNAETFYTNRYA